MKKKVLISALMFFTLIASAQLKYGPIAGIDYTNISYGKGVGAHIGGFVDFELLDRFGVRPEVIFAIKTGWDTENDITTFTRINFLEIPILTYFQISPHLNAIFGPQFNSSLGGESVTDGSSYEISGHGGLGLVVGLEKQTFSKLKLGIRVSSFGYESSEGISGESNSVLTIRLNARYTIDW